MAAARITIAVDAMGGDEAPRMVVRGVRLAALRRPNVDFLLYGDEAALQPLMKRHRRLLGDRVRIVHTDQVVGAEDKPSVALRRGRQSSMRLAIDVVGAGEADAVISAGNTGALMAMARLSLRMLPEIDRPAIAGVFPTRRGESVFLDLGANIECDADNLVDFAVMGAVFANTVLGRIDPTIGLLNVGYEELKGHDELRQAAARLREAEDPPYVYHGFVEGDDLAKGTTDVIVTDGFSGNVALKTAEGVSRLYGDFLKRALRSSWRGRLGYLLARSAFHTLREKVDPRRHNGAMFLGVNGTVVKSHGGTDALGFATAIEVAVDMVDGAVNARMTKQLGRLHGSQQVDRAAAAS
ncbi:MAG: phosphate acyltransferase PlsX [Alphaproteobacteria bacterium]|jgi:glycerol-3-phosphate acyltransferase PlsX|nr:phosphate acyltransferase PlsX [Alphaproteobacteria bacterium]